MGVLRPRRFSTRSLISAAPLSVKVMARISCGAACLFSISQAIRSTRTEVLPVPAPASICIMRKKGENSNQKLRLEKFSLCEYRHPKRETEEHCMSIRHPDGCPRSGDPEDLAVPICAHLRKSVANSPLFRVSVVPSPLLRHHHRHCHNRGRFSAQDGIPQ